jgi:hypothetical protein
MNVSNNGIFRSGTSTTSAASAVPALNGIARLARQQSDAAETHPATV